MSAPQGEKRRFPRFEIAIPVILRRKGGDVSLTTVDVSRHGAFVRIDPPLSMRQLVHMRFRLPEIGDVEAMCMVARSLGRDHPRGPGVGVDFFALSKDAKNLWERFVQSIRLNMAFAAAGQASAPAAGTPPLVQSHPLFPTAPPQAAVTGMVIEPLAGEGADRKMQAGADTRPVWFAPNSLTGPGAPSAVAVVAGRGPVTTMMAAVALPAAAAPAAPLAAVAAPAVPAAAVAPILLTRPPPPPSDDAPPAIDEQAVVMLRAPDREALHAIVERDVARGGMFLKTTLVKEVGEKIAVILVHPETDDEFHLEGTVVRRVITGPAEQRGLGIFFRALTPEKDAQLREFVERGMDVIELGTPITQLQLDLEAAVAKEPDSAEALEALGVYLLDEEGDLGGALTALTRAQVLGPSVVSIHASLARAYRKIGDTVRVRAHERVAEALMAMQERLKVRLGVGDDA